GVVLLHVAAGILLAVEILFLPAVRKTFGNVRLPKQAAGWGWLMGGSGVGLLLIFTGARRPLLPLLYVHIGACLVALALLVAAWAGTRGWLADGASATGLRYGLVLLVAAGLSAGAWWVRTIPWRH